MRTDSPLRVVARLVGATAVVLTVAAAVGCADLVDKDALEDFYHPAGWTEPGGANFHGTYVFDSPSELAKCTSCHGENFEGKQDAPACSSCHETYPHEGGWVAPSGGTHGVAVLVAAEGPSSCAPCHGNDYAGGSTGVACSTCHALYPHETAFGGAAASKHDDWMRSAGGWDLNQCNTCHGSSYDGEGWDSKNCLTCHSEDEGPESCETCHGDGDAGGPPPDLLGGTDTAGRGVGAHAAHAGLGEGMGVCLNCHAVPATYGAAGHIDDDPARAEITFGGLSGLSVASPEYDAATGTCGSTYCHGSWSFERDGSPFPFGYTDAYMHGNSAEVIWTEVGTGQAACGTCHGLPPTNHWDMTLCEACHPRGPDGKSPDPATHVNGMIDAIGESRPVQ